MAKETFWQRISAKYRISILNENTLNESGHIHLSRFGMFISIVLLFLTSFALFAAIIWFTPLKNYLPGYNENVRQELITATERIDSLSNTVASQTHYIDAIRAIVSGEVKTDTVQTLDSMALIQREALLEEKSAITEEFLAEYEAKEKDYLTLFDITTTTPVYTLYRPATGVIDQSFDAAAKHYGITIRTPKSSNVQSVLSGTVVRAEKDYTGAWMIILQHTDNYLSVYRNLKHPTLVVGKSVQAGEIIATVHDTEPLYFELWHDGKPVDPEKVIVF